MFSKILPINYLNSLDYNSKKNSVLCLDNHFFHIFYVDVENILNEEDRIEKIQAKLEIIFPKYEAEFFILKYELLKKEKGKEYLVVYLLNLEELNNHIIIDNMKDYNFVAIIPSFFICREAKDLKNFFNFDVSKQNLIVSEYMNNNIKEITSFKISNFDFEFDNEKIEDNNSYDIINTYLKNISSDTPILFTGENIDFANLEIQDKNYSFFACEKLNFSKYPNFLPDNLKNKFSLYYINTLYFSIILITTIITLISSIIIFYNINKYEDEIEILNTTQLKLEDEIIKMNEEMVEIEKEKDELQKLLDSEDLNNFKISSFLKKISSLCPEGIKINSIEYDDKKNFNIEGSSLKMDSIVNFFKNLSEVEEFKILNYDYILKNKNNIDFKLEIKFLGE